MYIYIYIHTSGLHALTRTRLPWILPVPRITIIIIIIIIIITLITIIIIIIIIIIVTIVIINNRRDARRSAHARAPPRM